ncbi:MAG: DHH family phosphoesterase [Verrucomicrobia bacterium]|nr:DHH family phosphoesterase [Verrucomicrobiota bacterium]
MSDPIANNATAADFAKRLLEFLERNRDTLSPLLILPHDFPDPDALSAAFGLQYLAQQRFGIESRIAFGGVIGRVENRAMVKLLRIPAHPLHKTDFKRYKQVALVDTQPAFRNNPFPRQRRATLVIDQHASLEPPNAELTLVDPGCGATCVIVAQALLLAAVEIPARLATALAYGILSDTLDLYRATRPDVVETYLSVLHHSDMRALARIQNPPRSRSYFVTLSRCVREAVMRQRLIVSHLGAVKVPEMVAQMAEHLLTYDRASWAFCTGRYKGRLHLSLRTSRPDAQAGEVLRDIVDSPKNAGGHRAIAGGSFLVGTNKPDELWQQQELTLQSRLVKRLRLSRRTEFRKAF